VSVTHGQVQVWLLLKEDIPGALRSSNFHTGGNRHFKCSGCAL
jgi:hypothetical protein